MVGDKISNLIISLKNASAVGKSTVNVPLTKLNVAILKVLQDEKFVASFEENAKSRTIAVELQYDEKENPAITEVKRISKLSKRVYFASKEIKSVKNGYGLAVISTPLGIMSGKAAREQKVGGELMFEIW